MEPGFGRLGGDGRPPRPPILGGADPALRQGANVLPAIHYQPGRPGWGRGPFLKNTKRSSPEGHFGRFGYVKPPRARGERALVVMAAPRPTGRAGGGGA